MLILLCALFLSLGLSRAEQQSLIVSFCKNAAKGEWRNNLQDTLAITRVGLIEIDCKDVSENSIAIATTIGNQYEQLLKPDEEHIVTFIDNVLRKLSYTKIKPANEESELQKLLMGNEDSIVSFIQDKYSTEHKVFQQLAISLGIPDSLQIIATHNAKILSNYIDLNVSKTMEAWYVKNGKWIALEIPEIEEGVTTTEEVHYKLTTYIKHLKYPPIFTYSGDDFVDTYDGSSLDFVLVFHATDQLTEVTKEIVEPLLKEFKLYFAFILIDSEKYPEMTGRFGIEKKSLPLLMLLKNGQKRGLLIDSDDIPYSLNSLVEALTLARKNSPKTLMVEPGYNMNSTNETESLPSDDDDHHHTEL